MKRAMVALLMVLGCAVLVAVPAYAAPPNPMNPWPSEPRYATNGDLTGWSNAPQSYQPRPGHPSEYASFWLSEGYYFDGAMRFDVRWNIQGDEAPSGDPGRAMLRVHYQGICMTISTGRLTYSPQALASIQPRWMDEDGPVTGTHTQIVTACTQSGAEPFGLIVEVGVGTFGDSSSIAVDRNVWFADTAHPVVPTATVFWCRAVFGPDYTLETVGLVGGVAMTAEQAGCLEDDWLDDTGDPTDFNNVCAGAPRAEWWSFSWLGPWVGHYADCLFVPRGSWDAEGRIAEVMEGGWFGEVVQLQDGLDGGVAGAGCGAAVYELPGPMGSISTCEVGSVWPENMRNLVGLAVVGTSSIACIFVLVRFMRVGAS